MKPNQKSSRRTPGSFVYDHNQPESWLTVISPFLTYINTRTLALLLFVSFTVLNTTHGNNGATKQQIPKNTETQIIAQRQHDVAQTATRPTNYTTPAWLIVWQLLSNIVNAFAQALNSPALIEYGIEQGVDTPGSLTTVCQDASCPSLPSQGQHQLPINKDMYIPWNLSSMSANSGPAVAIHSL